MSEILKPGENPLETKLEGLVKSVQNQGQILGLIDQWLLMNKKFFDQVKINEPPKATPTELVEPEKK